jgi:hypothetical protein
MNTTSIYKAFTVILIAATFILTAYIITSAPLPLGSDTYFHLKLADFYAHGQLNEAWNLTFTAIHYFYPPAFHILISPIALTSNPYLCLRILEAIFLPVTFTIALYLISKHHSPKAAFITGLTLLASWSFIDGALQCRPESLDLLLYPIITLAVLESRHKIAGFSAALMVWSHGFASLSYLVGFFLYKFKDKAWRKTLIATAAAITPILILSALYFGGALEMWGGVSPNDNPQEYLFWNNPYPWIFYYMGLTIAGIPFLFRKNKTPLETIFTYTIIGNLAMLPFWADRYLHYIAIPLAGLLGIGLSRWHGWKLYIALAALSVGCAVYISIYLLISINGTWWQPGN